VVWLAAHHQRVSVGSRFGHRFRGDHPACAGTVLHHDGLTKRFGQLLPQNSGGNVGAAAGREADENFDRLVGVSCGLAFGGGQTGGEGEAE
jgi:hypothetical protein